MQGHAPDSPGYDPTVAMLTDPTAPVPNPATDLMPGEARLDTVWNPYYGEVEAGTPPLAYLAFLPIPHLDDVTAAIEEQRLILNGEMQTRIEVLTGKRFQQKTSEGRPKEELDKIKKGREKREREMKKQDEERKAKAESDARERKARGDDEDEDEDKRRERGEHPSQLPTRPQPQPKK